MDIWCKEIVQNMHFGARIPREPQNCELWGRSSNQYLFWCKSLNLNPKEEPKGGGFEAVLALGPSASSASIMRLWEPLTAPGPPHDHAGLTDCWLEHQTLARKFFKALAPGPRPPKHGEMWVCCDVTLILLPNFSCKMRTRRFQPSC